MKIISRVSVLLLFAVALLSCSEPRVKVQVPEKEVMATIGIGTAEGLLYFGHPEPTDSSFPFYPLQIVANNYGYYVLDYRNDRISFYDKAFSFVRAVRDGSEELVASDKYVIGWWQDQSQTRAATIYRLEPNGAPLAGKDVAFNFSDHGSAENIYIDGDYIIACFLMSTYFTNMLEAS